MEDNWFFKTLIRLQRHYVCVSIEVVRVRKRRGAGVWQIGHWYGINTTCNPHHSGEAMHITTAWRHLWIGYVLGPPSWQIHRGYKSNGTVGRIDCTLHTYQKTARMSRRSARSNICVPVIDWRISFTLYSTRLPISKYGWSEVIQTGIEDSEIQTWSNQLGLNKGGYEQDIHI